MEQVDDDDDDDDNNDAKDADENEDVDNGGEALPNFFKVIFFFVAKNRSPRFVPILAKGRNTEALAAWKRELRCLKKWLHWYKGLFNGYRHSLTAHKTMDTDKC